ncbi:hypothetical protein LTR85_007934 [Meristemomyces frigidus]|nr:hypothetical protein LTR85_007934 [Meristemomyces frigidus]
MNMGQQQSQQFLAEVQQYLRSIPDQDPLTWHGYSRNVLRPLVNGLRLPNLAKLPQTPQAVFELETDGFELMSADARELLRDSEELSVPVFTEESLSSMLDGLSPVDALLSWFPTGKEPVEVPVASDLKASSGARLVTISDVRKRFGDKQSKNDPWNVLGTKSPLPDAALPAFLQDRNCSLLSDIARMESINAESASRPRTSGCDWHQMMSWILLAEAGALTTPHQDACGFGTWFQCYQGKIGFAWLSRPNEEDLQEWRNDPDGFQSGRWCYRMLQPGDVVYFDPGLVHFVFRGHGNDAQTMAIGGHILRRSAIGSWAKILHQQVHSITKLDLVYPQAKATPLPFNEDLSHVLHCAPVLLEAVNKLKEEIMDDLEEARKDAEFPKHLCSLDQLAEFEQFYPLLRHALKALTILRKQSIEIDERSVVSWSDSLAELLARSNRKGAAGMVSAGTSTRPADLQWKLVLVNKPKSRAGHNATPKASGALQEGRSNVDGAPVMRDVLSPSSDAASPAPAQDNRAADTETPGSSYVDDSAINKLQQQEARALELGAYSPSDDENITVAPRASPQGGLLQSTAGDEQLARKLQDEGKRTRKQAKPRDGASAWDDVELSCDDEIQEKKKKKKKKAPLRRRKKAGKLRDDR